MTMLGATRVRRPARRVRRVRIRIRRQEQLVLAEHAARQVGQDQAGLHAGHARANRRHERACLRRCPALRHLLHQRIEHDTRKPSTFAGSSRGRSTTATVPSSAAPGMPVSSRTGSATAAASCAQLGHDLPGLGHADLRARPDPADPGGSRNLPVDHLSAAHPSTVRGAGPFCPAGPLLPLVGYSWPAARLATGSRIQRARSRGRPCSLPRSPVRIAGSCRPSRQRE